MNDTQSGVRQAVRGATVLYGGSFDPPHLGHQMACLYLLEGLGAKAVWLVPTYRHPLKPAGTPFATRVELCRLMAGPFAEQVQVSRAEEVLGGRGFTYDLICHMQREHPKRRFVLAIGADLVAETPRWHRFADLQAKIAIVIVGRQGHLHPDPNTFSLPDITSSQIRADLAANISVLGRLPYSVAQAIAGAQLYGASSRT